MFHGQKGKGKKEYLYSTILADTPLTKRSDMQITPCLPEVVKGVPDLGVAPECPNVRN